MTWLVTGADGQLGSAFRQTLNCSNDQINFVNRSTCDLADSTNLINCLETLRPSIILNCAAYTAVDAAENDVDYAMRINAEAVGEIANWAAANDALLFHFSTDYVFDGLKTSKYSEDDQKNPLSVYGKSKALGEQYFFNAGSKGVCIRTSWVHSNDGNNFFLTMLKLLRDREHIKVVDDQRGVPTSTEFLAKVTLELISSYKNDEKDMPPVLHAVPDGETTWFGFACHIRDMLNALGSKASLAEIEPIQSSDFPQLAKRPVNSVMSNRLLKSLIKDRVGTWKHWNQKLYN